jgi:hypothetical protein
MARTQEDRQTIAQIAGTAARYSRESLSAEARQAAILEMTEVAGGRSDLLAEHAGVVVGMHEGDIDEARYLRAAQLCVEAGADKSLIPHWIEVGRHQARDVQAGRQTAR